MKKLLKTFLLIAFVSLVLPAAAQDYKTEKDIYYKNLAVDKDGYSRERCRLDICYPADIRGFKTIIWFHGGGLTGGEKDIPTLLTGRGICIVTVNYRLSPRAECPAYIEDAAASVAWVVANISRYGGDPSQVYVGGHSAGGYLASMLALDKSYLAKHGIDADDIKGYYPVSGQCITHNAVREERGLPGNIPLIDNYAPLAHARKDTAPILLTAGQREIELPGRTSENQYLYDTLRAIGNDKVVFHEISGFDHGTVLGPSILLILKDMGVN